MPAAWGFTRRRGGPLQLLQGPSSRFVSTGRQVGGEGGPWKGLARNWPLYLTHGSSEAGQALVLGQVVVYNLGEALRGAGMREIPLYWEGHLRPGELEGTCPLRKP